MEQETFKMAWREIDAEGKGTIETKQFVQHLQSKGHDEVTIDKWRQVLDSEDSGVISIDVYSEALDIHPDELKVEAEPKSLPSDVQYVSGDMPLQWQLKIVKATKDVLDVPNIKLSDISKRIKINLDSAYGSLWHVMVAHGQFSCYFGFQPGFSFIFKIGKQVFIVFKTPQT